MIGWKFAFTRRWAGYLVLTIIFGAACAGLGMWQFARRNEALVEINKVDANYDHTPAALTEALPTLDSFDESQKWLPVTMTGTYIVADQLIVRNRPMNVHPGFEVLTPLRLADGTVFVVDRGWVPTGETADAPGPVPVAPSGVVTVIARLKAGEPTLPGRTASGDQIATIHLADVAERVGAPTYTAAYGLMASEDPAPATRPAGVTRPVADEGSHLSYAFQWMLFALLGFIGLGWAVRQEFRSLNADDPEERTRAEERARRVAAKPRTDAEVEDDLIDSTR